MRSTRVLSLTMPVEVTENTLLDDRSAPTLHQDMVMRQSEQQAQARDRAEQQRPRAEWEAVMEASRATQRFGQKQALKALLQLGSNPLQRCIPFPASERSRP